MFIIWVILFRIWIVGVGFGNGVIYSVYCVFDVLIKGGILWCRVNKGMVYSSIFGCLVCV